MLDVAQEMTLLKLGTISLEGTKVRANASRHRALSHGHLETLESQLKTEVQELLALAEQADQNTADMAAHRGRALQAATPAGDSDG